MGFTQFCRLAGGVVVTLVGLAAGCREAAPPAAPAEAGLTCEAAECNTRGMRALELVRTDEAVALLDRACTLGHAVGCSNLAGVLRSSGGTTGGRHHDPARAVATYLRACELGFAEACSSVGSIYAEGKLVAADPARALAMFDRGCTGKDGNGCFTAGLFTAEGRGGLARDPAAAAGFFDRACALGHATGCFNAGMLLYRERGARPGDNERAASYFARACDGQQPAGCLRHGIAALRGHGGAGPDVQVAKDMFDRACKGGDADGCAAAEQVARGKGRPGDLEIALTSTAPTMAMAGLRVHDLECRMPEVGPMALGEAVEALAAHKAALDACAPAGEAPAVAWAWQGRRAAAVRVEGGAPKMQACVRRAVERARSGLRGTCSAVLLIGDPDGAQRALAERRSAGKSPTAVAAARQPAS